MGSRVLTLAAVVLIPWKFPVTFPPVMVIFSDPAAGVTDEGSAAHYTPDPKLSVMTADASSVISIPGASAPVPRPLLPQMENSIPG